MKRSLSIILAFALALGLSACGGTDETVSVQSVADIAGLGSVGIAERFAGVVSSRGEINVDLADGRPAGEILVAEGDDVEEGQVLFTYDIEAQEINYEKAQLELEQMKSTLESKKKEKEDLEKEKERASSSQQLEYSLEIQECETAIREQEYNIALKEKDLVRLAEALEVKEYTSPIGGRVKSLNPEGGYNQQTGEPLHFMTIVELGTYQVKGYVNEANAAVLTPGMGVLIRSRMDESSIWKGNVDRIDWENPQNGGNQFYYVSASAGDTGSSSKYPFYVELEDSDGLILGQHVYIEPDYGQDVIEDAGTIRLPSYFLFETNETTGYVWAEGSGGRLEKRKVSLGGFDEDMQTYAITDGLTAEDYIAFPEETVKEGMICEHFDPAAYEPGIENGADFENGVDYVDYGDKAEYIFDDGEIIGGADVPADGAYNADGEVPVIADEPAAVPTAAPAPMG